MKVGFTGTSWEMQKEQIYSFASLIGKLNPSEFHHGDCIGSDDLAHDTVRLYVPDTLIHIHPPIDDKKRAYKDADVMSEEKAYLVRNRNIVDATYVLIATPRTEEETVRGGTWYTIRYARKLGRSIYIICPDGKIVEENVE